MGANHLELDVHATSDSHVVVIHDDTVDRTTDGSGPVASQTLAALGRLDAGGWFDGRFAGERIPTLRDVVARYKGRAYLHVEIKGRSNGLPRRTVDAICDGGMADGVTITSFQRVRLEETREYAPGLPTGWLVAEATEAIVAQARAMGLTQLCPKASTLTPDLVRRLRAQGLGVRAWGVANEELMRQVVSAGADGMTVNFPDKLIAYLKSLRA
jgi:glycerophosphoryl diester phosphodiesterase